MTEVEISTDSVGQMAKCGVCGNDVTLSDLGDPPAFRYEPDPGNPRIMRPVLSKPIRVDPETGAVCWCGPSAHA
jgi:hypothetical protein